MSYSFFGTLTRLRRGETTKNLAARMNVTAKMCTDTIAKVADALGLPEGSDPRAVAVHDRRSSRWDIFHDGIARLLDTMTALDADCRACRDRVIVMTSEFSTQWLLPHVLEQSKFLQKQNAELEIKRAYHQGFLDNLKEGSIDIALGPRVKDKEIPAGIAREKVLTVPRAIIYHKDHEFARNVPQARITLADLAWETVFVLSITAVPDITMDKWLPEVEKGRRIVLDSISHMYQYVSKDLGVALGYPEGYGPLESYPSVRKITSKRRRNP